MKSTLLKKLFPEALRFDLLLSTDYQSLLRTPQLIREFCEGKGLNAGTQKEPVIIDELVKSRK